MRGDRALDLKAHHVIFQPALLRVQAQHPPARKLDLFILCADFVEDVTIGIHIAAFGFVEQVVAQLQGEFLALHPSLLVDVDTHLDADAPGFRIDADQLNEGLIVAFVGQHAVHLDLLDQAQVVSLHRVQRIQQVVRVLMGGGVAQRTQRV